MGEGSEEGECQKVSMLYFSSHHRPHKTDRRKKAPWPARIKQANKQPDRQTDRRRHTDRHKGPGMVEHPGPVQRPGLNRAGLVWLLHRFCLWLLCRPYPLMVKGFPAQP